MQTLFMSSRSDSWLTIQLSIGYRLRRASMLDAPEWLEVTAESAKKDPYVALIDIAITIPRLLERTDKLTRSRAAPEEWEQLVKDSQAVADRAFAWLANFENEGPLFDRVPVEQLEDFHQAYQDHTWDPVFIFKTFATYTTLINYWMAMLILRSNTFAIVRNVRQLEPRQLMMWDRELSSYAENICRGVPYGCRAQAGYSGRFGALTPLVVAKKYYEAKKATKEVAWCEKVYYGTQVPGLYSPPPMEPSEGVRALRQNSTRYL